MLGSILYMISKVIRNHIFSVKKLRFFHYVRKVVMDIIA